MILRAALAGVALWLAACAPAGPHPPARVRLGIAAQQSPSQVVTYLTFELGHFRDEGLDVRLQEFAGSSRGLEALIGGSLDVLSGYYEQTIQMAAEGRPLQAFVTTLGSHLVALAVSPTSSRRIARIEDLRGATVGVTTLGSATHHFLNFLLARAGLRPDEVRPIAIGTASRAVAAIGHGRVDAGIITGFTVSHLEKRFGKVVVLADTRTEAGVRETYGVDRYPSTVLCATTAWVRRNPATARRLARAILRTLAWIRRRSPEEVVARLPESFHGEHPAILLETIRGAIPLLVADGRMPASGPEAARRVLAASLEKVRTASVDLSATYTNAFVAGISTF